MTIMSEIQYNTSYLTSNSYPIHYAKALPKKCQSGRKKSTHQLVNLNLSQNQSMWTWIISDVCFRQNRYMYICICPTYHYNHLK